MPNGKGSKSHSSPDHGGGDPQKRKVTGEIRVSGSVETNITSGFIEQYKAAKNENTPRDNWRFVVEVITLIVLLAYAGITAFIYLANNTSAKAALSAANTADSTLRLTERAWIVVKLNPPFDFTKFPDKAPVTLNVTFLNTGKTPAWNVKGTIAANLMPTSYSPDFSYQTGSGEEVTLGGTMSPDHPIIMAITPKITRDNLTISSETGPVGEAATVSENLRINIRKNAWYLAINGRVTYDDIFGDHHWVQFCFPLGNDTTFGFTKANMDCTKYNDTDKPSVEK